MLLLYFVTTTFILFVFIYGRNAYRWHSGPVSTTAISTHRESSAWTSSRITGVRLSPFQRYGATKTRGSQRDVVYLVWPTAPLFMSPTAGGRGAGYQPMIIARYNSIFNLWLRQFIFQQINTRRLCSEFSPIQYLTTTNFFVFLKLKRNMQLRWGHLHLHPGLTCPARESNPGLRGGRRALYKRANSYSKYRHMRARPVKNARDTTIIVVKKPRLI